MANIESTTKTSNEKRRDRRVNEQFPVDTDIMKKAVIDTGSGELVRIVVMNNIETAQCAAFQEYHHSDASISIEDITSFTLRCGSIGTTQAAIDSFVDSMPLQFSLSQAAGWVCGVYSPSAARKRLYKATDPDDATKMIGILLEQNSSGDLTEITWYKTTNTGPIFSSMPEALSFSLVMDENEDPSVDPGDIGGWTWYYTTSYGRSS